MTDDIAIFWRFCKIWKFQLSINILLILTSLFSQSDYSFLSFRDFLSLSRASINCILNDRCWSRKRLSDHSRDVLLPDRIIIYEEKKKERIFFSFFQIKPPPGHMMTRIYLRWSPVWRWRGARNCRRVGRAGGACAGSWCHGQWKRQTPESRPFRDRKWRAAHHGRAPRLPWEGRGWPALRLIWKYFIDLDILIDLEISRFGKWPSSVRHRHWMQARARAIFKTKSFFFFFLFFPAHLTIFWLPLRSSSDSHRSFVRPSSGFICECTKQLDSLIDIFFFPLLHHKKLLIDSTKPWEIQLKQGQSGRKKKTFRAGAQVAYLNNGPSSISIGVDLLSGRDALLDLYYAVRKKKYNPRPYIENPARSVSPFSLSGWYDRPKSYPFVCFIKDILTMIVRPFFTQLQTMSVLLLAPFSDSLWKTCYRPPYLATTAAAYRKCLLLLLGESLCLEPDANCLHSTFFLCPDPLEHFCIGNCKNKKGLTWFI